jgi:hypothetical protein
LFLKVSLKINLDTENLYKINKELTSNIKIKVYKVFEKNINGIKTIKQ